MGERDDRTRVVADAVREFIEGGRARESGALEELLTPFLDEPPDVDGPEAEDGWVLGDYRVEECIGRGGMGVVHRARQLSLDRPVALKLLPEVHLSDPRRLARFRREARIGGRLEHPGIVRVFAVGQEGRHHFIAQELVAGGRTLADAIPEWRVAPDRGREHFRGIARTLASVADALATAHADGVVHRDVKPSNILLTPAGEPKVSDFGLALAEDSLALSRSGEPAGTPYYMSPEQARGSRSAIGPASDVFSLGATLYECLTLRRPFPGASTQRVIQRILHAEPPPIGELEPRVPRPLRHVCLRALEKEPEARYPSMRAFADDLRAFASGEPVAARPPSPASRAARWVRRHPAVTAVTTLSVASSIVVSALLVENRVARADADGARGRAETALAESQELVGALEVERERVRAEAERARREARTSEQVVELLVGLADDATPGSSTRGTTLASVLDRAMVRVARGLEAEPEVRGRLRLALGALALASTELSLADVLLTGAIDDLAEVDRRSPSETVALQLASARSALAEARFNQGRLAEAEELLRQVLDTVGAELGPRLADTARMQLSRVLVALERSGESLDLIREVAESEPKDGPKVTDTDTAQTLLQRNHPADFAAALELADSGLRATEERWGPRHPRTIAARLVLGRALMQNQRVDEAGPVLTSVAADAEAVLGPEHLLSIHAVLAVASHELTIGEFDEAIRGASGVLKILEESDAPAPVFVMQARLLTGHALHLGGHHGEGRRELARAVEVSASAFGEGAGVTYSMRHVYGLVCRYDGAFDEARAEFETVLEGFRRLDGEQTVGVWQMQAELAWLMARDGDHDEAIVILEDLAHTTELTGDEYPELRGIIHLYLGQLLEQAGEVGEDLRHFELARGFLDRPRTKWHQRAFEAFEGLARVYVRDELWGSGLLVFERIVEHLTLVRGATHAQTLLARVHVVRCLGMTGLGREAAEAFELLRADLPEDNPVRAISWPPEFEALLDEPEHER